VAKSALGLVVGWWQGMIGDEGHDGSPVVENFTGEGPDFLCFMVAIKVAGAFQTGLDRVENGVVLVLGDGLDQIAQFAYQPLTEAHPIGGEAAGQRQPFSDDVRIMPTSA
jgi:hypothetical protein